MFGATLFRRSTDGSAELKLHTGLRLTGTAAAASGRLKIFKVTYARATSRRPAAAVAVAAVRSLDEESINRLGWGQRERSFLLGSVTLVNRFRTNADRDATNYNGVDLIDRIAAELEIAGSLLLALR